MAKKAGDQAGLDKAYSPAPHRPVPHWAGPPEKGPEGLPGQVPCPRPPGRGPRRPH